MSVYIQIDKMLANDKQQKIVFLPVFTQPLLLCTQNEWLFVLVLYHFIRSMWKCCVVQLFIGMMIFDRTTEKNCSFLPKSRLTVKLFIIYLFLHSFSLSLFRYLFVYVARYFDFAWLNSTSYACIRIYVMTMLMLVLVLVQHCTLLLCASQPGMDSVISWFSRSLYCELWSHIQKLMWIVLYV